MLAILIASVLTSHDPSLCGDISGEWTSGWAPTYTGGGASSSSTRSMVVRKAVTPWGTPHAGYVVDYRSALAVHPDLQTCLGNGTCSVSQFGRARALNSSSPGCTFIQWPIDRPTNGGWCKVPFCPPSPKPPPPPPPPPPLFPPFNVTWEPTYVMSRSTITNPNGSPNGLDEGASLKQDSRFGIIAFDGSDMLCKNYRLGPAKDPCMYAKTWSNLEELARQIKAVNPNTHVWHYRNMQLRLTRNEFDCPKMYDPSYAGYFLHNKDGSYLNSTAGFPWSSTCEPYFPNATYSTITTQYYLDWRNESARNWWLDVHIGSIINSSVVDGFYWDDPVFGNEGMWIRDQYTPEELADIDSNMQATRLEAYNRLSRGGGFCTGSTCPTSIPDVADCTCTSPHSNCTCDYSPGSVTQNVMTSQSKSGNAVLMHVPYPFEFHRVDGGPYNVTCSGPAVVQWQPDPASNPPNLPHPVQLSCLPGSGTMTVDFASFGLPTIGRGVPVLPGRGVRQADCSTFAANSSCDAGATVLQQLKALCDGKQSCRFNTSHPIFTRPSSGCGDLPVSALQLAVRASGCQFGTGSGVVLHFREQLAMFLLARGDHWWMGNDWIAAYPPVFLPEWDVDYGIPISNLTVVGGVLSRQWSKMEVRLDANTFEATFDPPSRSRSN